MDTVGVEFSGSPYRSDYPRTEVVRGTNGAFRPVTFRRARKHFCPRDSVRSRSPTSRQHYAPISRPPDAPRPFLQVNEDTVLFANTKLMCRAGELPKVTTARENRSSTTLSPNFMISEDGIIDNIPKTSTPFARYLQADSDPSELLNTALIGAPRLALNLSVTESSEESHKPDNTDSRCHVLPACKVEFLEPSGTTDQLILDANLNGKPRSHVCKSVHSSCKSLRNGTDPSKPNDFSINQFRCRICLEEGDGAGALFSPCRCKGTVGLIHRTCLQRWLFESGKPNCELCGYAYIMTPSRRKSISLHSYVGTSEQLNPFREWLNSTTTRRHLLTDLICLAFLTPSTYIGVYFCIVGAIGYDSEDSSGWQVVGLWCLAVLMILLLCSWVILATRHHVSNYKRHLRFRRQREREEAERLAALPRWRFSIQPRPRGSSTLVRSRIESEQAVSYQSTISVDAQPSESPSSNNKSVSEVEVHAQFIPIPDVELPVVNSPELHVSLAVSNVSELMEGRMDVNDGRLL